MSYFYWKRREPLDKDTDPNHSHEPALPVDEQHALPVALHYTPNGATGASAVGDGAPLPVFVPDDAPPVTVVGRLTLIPPMLIPGITTGDALDANDAFGRAFPITVPRAGAIVNCLIHDLDDEGTATMTMHVFRSKPADAPVSDAAWTLSDNDNELYVGTVIFNNSSVPFIDGGNNFISRPDATSLPLWYVSPAGELWLHFQCAGTPTIAASNIPKVSLTIHEYET